VPEPQIPLQAHARLAAGGGRFRAAFAAGAAPEWVADWLARRQAKSEKKAAQATAVEAKPVDEKAQARRAEQRDTRIRDGLDRIELWMADRVREGLSGLEAQPTGIWSDQAKRLVDAQAPGIAAWVTAWGELIGSKPDWPRRLLAEFGRLELLIQAYRRLDELEPALQSDIRQVVGWNVPQDEVDRTGERVEDTWAVVGQRTEDAERVRVQRSWLIGRRSGHTALFLQFSAGGQPFAESIAAGTDEAATLAYYPGAARQRAKFVARAGVAAAGDLPRGRSIAELLDDAADRWSHQPWTSRFGYVVRQATFVPTDGGCRLRDEAGDALPLTAGDYWKAMALGGGTPTDVAVEWNGESVRPLGMIVDGVYRTL